MNNLAVIWTAVGSIAAFLAILATIAVYLFQSRGDKAAGIRQNLQFIHGQQTQVVPSIESGLVAIIDRQIREFREHLGSATPSYFLEQLFGNDEPSGDRSLFLASALDSNLSSTTYSRMSDIWDGLNMKAFEFRGLLRIFSYACEILTAECRRLCGPEFTVGILDIMAEREDRDALDKIHSLDELVNRLLADQVRLARCQFAQVHKERIGQGCFFLGMLADIILRLPDTDLLKLARTNVQQPLLDELKKTPCQAIESSLDLLAKESSLNLQEKLREKDIRRLHDVLHGWDPQPADAQPTGLTRSEACPSRPSSAKSGVITSS